MIDYKKILGDSGKDFISYTYNNKTYKVMKNEGEDLTWKTENNKRDFNDLFKIFFPILLQIFISYKASPLYFGVMIFFFIAYLSMKINKLERLNHGAEHIVLNALENNRELKMDEIRKESYVSYRCGGNFMIYALIVSVVLRTLNINIILSVLINSIITNVIWKYKDSKNPSYKKLTYLLRKPSEFMQKHFTVANPKDENIEIAVVAIENLLCDK